MSRQPSSSPEGSDSDAQYVHVPSRPAPTPTTTPMAGNRLQSGLATPATTEGYPSWLPRRAPAPEPASTMHSSHSQDAAAGPSNRATPSAHQPPTTPVSFDPSSPPPSAWTGGGGAGRKPTPRSVRVVRMSGSDVQPYYGYGHGRPQPSGQGQDRRVPTDQTRVSQPHAAAGHGYGHHPRVWSRATTAGVDPTLFSSTHLAHAPRPRFRAPALHLELLRNPSARSRLHFVLFPLFVFAHIPIQTFLDFNAVFILVQVALFPNPVAPGVSGSGRNWALGAAAYIACWAVWIFIVTILYELVYSFVRRWRVKRPLMLSLYLSAPANNFVCLTSFTNFCFLQHMRLAAFSPAAGGSFRDGLAETFFFYSQNLPTVALLLPRAGLCLALLFTFASAPLPGNLASANAGFDRRDGTFFHDDGTLTAYARGVLIANAAWTAWRVLVLLVSWLGLWVLSGQGCAGLCGPRYRWQEDEAEKTMSIYSDGGEADPDVLPWQWKEATALRMQEAWEFCLTNRSRNGKEKEYSDTLPPVRESGPAFEGMDQLLAAIGIGGAQPHPSRRTALTDNFFAAPTPPPAALDSEAAVVKLDSVPDVQREEVPSVEREGEPEVQRKGKAKLDPLGRTMPYPFPGYSSQESQEGRIPFPPSPAPSAGEETGSEQPVPSHPTAGTEEEEDEEGEAEEGEEEEEGDYTVEADESDLPSSTGEPKGRSSGSMSSLGRPMSSRYPFQFRRPAATTATHQSFSTAGTHRTPQSGQSRSQYSHSHSASNSRSTPSSRPSHISPSTGPRSSAGSPGSPGSDWATSSPIASSMSAHGHAGIPMPPSHPRAGTRARAGTVPSSPSPANSSSSGHGRQRARTRAESAESAVSRTFGPVPIPLPLGLYAPHQGGEEWDEYDGQDDTLEMMEQPEAEGSEEGAEVADEVGLLSAGPSPKSSRSRLRQRASTLSLARSRGSRHSGSRASRSGSGSNSGGSRTNSMSGSSAGARSRAQSLIQSLGAASRSSVDLVAAAVRARTESMARWSGSASGSERGGHGSPYQSGAGSSAASDGVLSSVENHTFGHPLRAEWTHGDEDEGEEQSEDGDGRIAEEERGEEDESEDEEDGDEEETQHSPPRMQHALESSESRSQRTVVRQSETEADDGDKDQDQAEDDKEVQEDDAGTIAGVGIDIPRPGLPHLSHTDISTANASFVTAPATLSSGTTSGPGSWGGASRSFFDGQHGAHTHAHGHGHGHGRPA